MTRFIDKITTRRVVAWTFFALLAYELVTLVFGHKSALISPVMKNFLQDYNTVSLGFGILVGHFVLVRRSWMPWPAAPGWLWGVSVPLLVGLGFCADIWTIYRLAPEIGLILGMLVGHFTWAQKAPIPSPGTKMVL